MKNNSYWSNRSKERMMQYHKDSNNTINIIHKAYDKAIKDIEKDIKNIHDNLVINGQLSPEDTKQLLNTKVSKKEIEELRRLISSMEDPDTKKYLLARLNSPAYRARMTRLEHLKENIYIRSKQIASVEIQASTSQYIDTINQAYYRNMFDIQKGLGLGFSFNSMNDKAIKAILNNPWSGKHFSQRIWNNTDILAEQLTEILTSGFMSGMSIDNMARELRDRANIGKYVAARLIRTETTYMANAAEMESYKECDIEKYIYIATLDLRTSKECRELDREVFEVSKAVPGENLPPMHPNCRSSTRSYISGEELSKIQRRARDPITGKTYLIPADMNYEQWYQKYVIDKYGRDQAEVMEKKIKNKGNDKEQHNRYKEILGKDTPKSFDKFQELKYNNSEEWDRLKLYYKDQNIRNYIKSDELPKEILIGKQGKHILGHNNYIEGRSYMSITLEELQQIVNKNAGTGHILRDNKGQWSNKELIEVDKILGVTFDTEGKARETKKAIIHYSKKGTHIVPTLRKVRK